MHTLSRRRWIAVWAIWLAFVVSFFLPATSVAGAAGTSPGTPMTGWQAFVGSLFALAAQPLFAVAEPRSLLLLLFPLVNLAMLFSPLILWSAEEHAWLGSIPYLLCGLLAWSLPECLLENLHCGFYIWNGSIFALAATCIFWKMEADIWHQTQIRAKKGS